LTVQQVLNPGVANAGVAATTIFFFFALLKNDIYKWK